MKNTGLCFKYLLNVHLIFSISLEGCYPECRLRYFLSFSVTEYDVLLTKKVKSSIKINRYLQKCDEDSENRDRIEST